MQTQEQTARTLLAEHHSLMREPERIAVDTIEELLLGEGFTPAEIAAGITFVLRESRRVHPRGEFDSGGRWYPDDEEQCDCCGRIRSPSRAYPYSYMVHCRTIKHVANLYGVGSGRVRKAANTLAASDANDSLRHYAWVD